MATIKYVSTAGEVEFAFPILTIARVPIRSETKQAVILIRNAYTVRSIITASANQSLDELIEHYRAVLSIARGELTIEDPQFAKPLVANAENDLERGPLPTAINIEKVIGGRTAIVNWSIVTTQFPGDWTNAEADKWIDWVYTIRTLIDSNFNAKRIISGFLRLAPNHANFDGRTADAYRDSVANWFPLPVFPNGLWQRISTTWAVSADLTTLGFTITDQQVYSYLPINCLDGDVIIDTRVSADGNGSWDLSGWFIGNANTSRGEMQARCFFIMEAFWNEVLVQIDGQTDGALSIREESTSYRHHLKSNRVDFRTRWTMWGMIPGLNMASKLEYTATTAANYLAMLSRAHYEVPPIDIGPYGTAQVCGLNEEIAPIIDIDWADKEVVPFSSGTTQPTNPGDGTDGTPGADTPASRHFYFRQRYRFTVKDNRYVANGTSSPVIIQTRPAEVYLQIIGESERPDPELTIPQPPFPLATSSGQTGQYATILEATVTPVSPTIDGNYRITWNLLLRIHNLDATIVNGMTDFTLWPYTPMLPDAPPNSNWVSPLGRPVIEVKFPNENSAGLD